MRLRSFLPGLTISLLVVSLPARAAEQEEPADDVFLRGYIVSYMEQVLHLRPNQVQVAVDDGVVILTGTVITPEEIDRIVDAVIAFPGVRRVVNRLEVEEAGGRRRFKSWTDWLRPPPGRKTVRYPSGDLFTPPLADQKQPILPSGGHSCAR